MTSFQFLRRPGSVVAPCLLSAALIAVADVGAAKGLHIVTLQPPGPILAKSTAASPETVRLRSGLAKIESNRPLDLLFLKDGLVNLEGSHFTHPRTETFPGIKDGLAAAGVADFEPLLVALEGGSAEEAGMAAFTSAVGALMQAWSTLRPSARDKLLSIVEQTRAVADETNPAGPTEANNYQDAWAILMVRATRSTC